jgi:hypothetical protein
MLGDADVDEAEQERFRTRSSNAQRIGRGTEEQGGKQRRRDSC